MRAFSLIELLVTLTLIAILMALAVPSLSRSRAAARTLVCISNLRQCHLSITAYSLDWDTLPQTADWPATFTIPRACTRCPMDRIPLRPSYDYTPSIFPRPTSTLLIETQHTTHHRHTCDHSGRIH